MVKIEMQGQSAVVWMYAYVGDCDFNGPAFQFLIDDLKQQGATEVLLRLHSYGGVVFDGNMIANTIETSPIPVDILIVGVCASMAAILMLKARKISIVANGFVMIHTPSGFTDGDAAKHLSAAKLLQSMQDQFAIDLCARTGKDEAYTAKWLDGQDHWMNATELLTEGLVDEVVQIENQAPEELTVEAVAALGPKAVFNRFTASLEAGAKIPPDNKKSMDKKRTIEKYKLTGVTEASTDEEVEAALEAHINGIAKTAEETTEQAIDTLVEGLGTDVTAAAKDNYKAIGKKMGVASLKTLLADVKPYASITGQIQQAGGNKGETEAQKDWDWDRYQKENPKALIALEKTDKATFDKLYKAKYGKA